MAIQMGHLSKNNEGALDLSYEAPAKNPIVKQAHNQALVDLFTNMPAHYREVWLTKPVVLIQDQWRRTDGIGKTPPDTVRIEFRGGPTLQYTSRHIVCEIASAMQECSDWKPSFALDDYLKKYRKIEHVQLRTTINPEGADFKLLDSGGDAKIAETLEKWKDFVSLAEVETDTATPEDKPAEFSKAPFKLIQDYLHACAFLSPFAPHFVDYANALLVYRLGYTISQEKDLAPETALRALARELNDYAKNHPDGAHGLTADMNPGLFADRFTQPSLLIKSDFSILNVQYEPDLLPVEWEKRYQALRTRHAG